jgi:hypothetical protein
VRRAQIIEILRIAEPHPGPSLATPVRTAMRQAILWRKISTSLQTLAGNVWARRVEFEITWLRLRLGIGRRAADVANRVEASWTTHPHQDHDLGRTQLHQPKYAQLYRRMIHQRSAQRPHKFPHKSTWDRDVPCALKGFSRSPSKDGRTCDCRHFDRANYLLYGLRPPLLQLAHRTERPSPQSRPLWCCRAAASSPGIKTDLRGQMAARSNHTLQCLRNVESLAVDQRARNRAVVYVWIRPMYLNLIQYIFNFSIPIIQIRPQDLR